MSVLWIDCNYFRTHKDVATYICLQYLWWQLVYFQKSGVSGVQTPQIIFSFPQTSRRIMREKKLPNLHCLQLAELTLSFIPNNLQQLLKSLLKMFLIFYIYIVYSKQECHLDTTFWGCWLFKHTNCDKKITSLQIYWPLMNAMIM